MNKWLTCFAAALALTMFGCDDSDSNDASQNSCTADKCKNSETLYKCTDGVVSEVKCGEGHTCVNNACKPNATVEPGDKCTADKCKDADTLYKCTDGVVSEVKCGEGQTCVDDACKPKTPVDPGDKCTADKCKDSSTLYKCTDGVVSEVKCGEGQTCVDDACKSDASSSECTKNVCDENDPSKLKKCENGKFVETLCAEGEVCEGGGCMKQFTIGEECGDADGFGKCTADRANAIVCHKGKITRYTCAEPCTDGEDGFVDCSKKATKPPVEKECKDSEFVPECSPDKSSVKLCQHGKFTTWNCADNSCAVDSKGGITCDRVPPDGALTEGGTYGDPCDPKRYQEKCIDKYYALICDSDYVVRVKPAGDCAPDSKNPLKVVYTKSASCDPETQIMPFCINDGKAIGYCAYLKDGDSTQGEFLAAQCANCTSEERAEECMRE